MLGLVRAADGDVEVLALRVGERRELDVELLEVRAGDLLVELLREHVHAERERGVVRPERDLREHLVRERERHHRGRVARRAAEVHETALGEEDDVPPVRHRVAVDLRLDVDDGFRVRLEPSDVDLDIEVADVGDDRILGHSKEVLAADDVTVTGSGNKNVGTVCGILHSRDFVASHRSLKRVDGVDLGNENTRTVSSQGLCALRCH